MDYFNNFKDVKRKYFVPLPQEFSKVPVYDGTDYESIPYWGLVYWETKL